ncbi:hypothetical protein Q4E93_34385 [Flavitalea sp. BT771]|uniref:hypothetical protein n=1 Tax=Flavitalea sp. BT771 TaxID=3063329 RepID=UPI0026E15594|nr:hypothetical protein [Flavitalea sp. BT771]MDO6435754.1 hypothetical protein [Flavitalea sp. BT771]MDV6224655.1 hypothetical protein [Flavitalea sp. BT771]
MLNDSFPFADYVRDLYQQLKVLKKLSLPTPIQWTIDWDAVRHLAGAKGQRNRAHAHDFFEEVRKKKAHPAVYFFTIQRADREAIFKAFVHAKEASANLRIHHGVKHPDFRNISHVPASCGKSSCLYVGSVKKNLATRIRQHLGLTNSGRTRAMYLYPLLQDLPKLPVITVTVYFFEQRYVHLTEHMEYVFQKDLKPLLGKRSVIDILPVVGD